MLTVLLGGARSGKSALAVRRGERFEAGGGSVTFVATSPRIDGDDDLDLRIAAHQAERPRTWPTIEEERDLARAVTSGEAESLVIIDCLTLWVSNLMHSGNNEADVLTACHTSIEAIRSRPGPTLAISNEVGLGIVPMNELARIYRDVLGRVNQRFVAASDEALLLVAGRAVHLTDPG